MTINMLTEKIDTAKRLCGKLEEETKTFTCIRFEDGENGYWELEVRDAVNIDKIIYNKEFETIDELIDWVIALWTGAMITNRKDI